MIDNTCTDHPKGGAGSNNAGGGGWDPNNHRWLDGNCGGPGFNTCNTCGKGTYRPEAIAYDGTSFELCWQEIGKPKSIHILFSPKTYTLVIRIQSVRPLVKKFFLTTKTDSL